MFMYNQQFTEGVHNLPIFIVYRKCPFEDFIKIPKRRFEKGLDLFLSELLLKIT